MAFLWTYCKFIGLAILAAGLFGAVHDQISYTLSYEYFTRFKFHQFHLVDSPLPERWLRKVNLAEQGRTTVCLSKPSCG